MLPYKLDWTASGGCIDRLQVKERAMGPHGQDNMDV